MPPADEHATRRRNFIEQGTAHFDFLCADFGYTGPVHTWHAQPNGAVIMDTLTYTHEAIDRVVQLVNAWHPVDYGFELRFCRPSVSVRAPDCILGHTVLQEAQDSGQGYLADAAALARGKYLGIISGAEWPGEN